MCCVGGVGLVRHEKLMLFVSWLVGDAEHVLVYDLLDNEQMIERADVISVGTCLIYEDIDYGHVPIGTE